MAKTLYDDDIVTWSQQQVEGLKKLARQPMLTNAVDWENIVEEIESLGRSEVDQVSSLLRNLLIHIVKACIEPDSAAVRVWFRETRAWLIDIRKKYKPSMKNKIDLDNLWWEGVEAAGYELADYGKSIPLGFPQICPFGMKDILDPAFDLDRGFKLASNLPPDDPRSLRGTART